MGTSVTRECSKLLPKQRKLTTNLKFLGWTIIFNYFWAQGRPQSYGVNILENSNALELTNKTAEYQKILPNHPYCPYFDAGKMFHPLIILIPWDPATCVFFFPYCIYWYSEPIKQASHLTQDIDFGCLFATHNHIFNKHLVHSCQILIEVLLVYHSPQNLIH